MSVDGILNVLKPAGKTSFAVVSLLRRWSGERRVGHAGTLDPDATGVLVVCLGQATRIVEFLAGAGKTYRAEIELGVTTDTYDAAGKVVGRSDPSSVTEEQVRRVLESFRGTIAQVPPMHSAIHHKGKRLYELARQGIEVDREPRQVEISRLELLAWQPPVVTIEVDCSGGTYIRSLAQDIGTALGCGAHLKRLVRLKSGPFHLDDAVSLDSPGRSLSRRRLADPIFTRWTRCCWTGRRPSSTGRARPWSGKGRMWNCTSAGDTGPAGSQLPGLFCRRPFSWRFSAKTDAGLWHPEKVFSCTQPRSRGTAAADHRCSG